MSKRYVDNAQNRRLGRVGLPLGSMPEHKDNRGTTSTGNEQPARNGTSSDTYVDNAQNRGLGRVGLPKGSAVVSKTSSNKSLGANASINHGDSVAHRMQPAQSGACADTYVDNAENRKLGRVGLPKGSAVVSKVKNNERNDKTNDCVRSGVASAAEHQAQPAATGTYADNAFNRKHGRAGMPKGTMVVSKAKNNNQRDSDSRNSSPDSVIPAKSLNGKNYEVAKQMGTVDSFSDDTTPIGHRSAVKSGPDGNLSVNFDVDTTDRRKVYVDNPQNRKLGRVGMYHGEAVVCKDSNISHVPATDVKRYVDSPTNQRLGRVGLPVGTAVFSSKNKCVMQKNYDNSSLNIKLGRAGKPLGSLPIQMKKSKTTAKIPEMLKRIEDKDEFSDYRFEDRGSISCDMGLALLDSQGDRVEAYDQAMYRHNRLQEEISWEQSGPTKAPPKTQFDILKDYKGKKIPYDELKLRKVIGSGGFGRVYFAKWQETVVAVKKLQNEKISESRIKDFSVEVLKFCTLDHPNIVKFIGACVEKPNLCIVMEYMQMTLYDALHVKDDTIDFSDAEQIDIINQTSAGLEYLHTKRIAHCDLKTPNILMDYVQDEICEVKITDFGLSMIIHDTSVSVDELVRNIGTPQYSPPEMLRGEVLSAKDMMKADVYSLAIVLLEVIFKDEPFPDYTYQQLKNEVGIAGNVPEVPSSPDIDESIKDIMNRAWSFEPRERPTVSDICETVRKCQSIYKD